MSGNCSRTPGSRRKRKTTDRSDRFIVKRSKAGTPTKKQQTGEVEAQTGVKVSPRTIHRRLKEKGINWRKKSKKLYVREKNCLLPLSFAREHIGWSVDQWKRVVSSNKSPFCLQNQSAQYVRRINNKKRPI